MDEIRVGSNAGESIYYPGGAAMRVNGVLKFILSDHLGSTSVMTDASGAELGRMGYYPFGKTRYTSGSLSTDRLYTGQQQVAGIGLYNYKARYYDPGLGRFISADTITPGGPQGLNRYSMVNNNPINFSDPSGNKPCSDEYGCSGKPTPPSNQPADPVKLTTQADCQKISYKGGCYTGEQMQLLFKWYSTNPGWWNESSSQSFTIEDFLTIILFAELGSVLKDPAAFAYAKAVAAEKAMALCAYTNGSCFRLSNNALLNYAATRESATIRYDNISKYGFAEQPVNFNGDMSQARAIADYMVGYSGKGSWSDWGNASMFEFIDIDVIKTAPVNTTARDGFLYRSGGINPLLIATSDQLNFWTALNNQ